MCLYRVITNAYLDSEIGQSYIALQLMLYILETEYPKLAAAV